MIMHEIASLLRWSLTYFPPGMLPYLLFEYRFLCFLFFHSVSKS